MDNPGDGHDREDVGSPDIMVIITDGAANTGGTGEAEATAAKADSIEIFAVGVGISTSAADALKALIVSPPPDDHYFDSASFSDLSTILAGIVACEE